MISGNYAYMSGLYLSGSRPHYRTSTYTGNNNNSSVFGNSSSNRYPGALNNINKTSIAAYEKIKTAAASVREQGWKLMSTEESSLINKAEKSGDKKELVNEIQKFADDYNTMLTAMKKQGGSVNTAYAKQMEQVCQNQKEQLEKVGITILKDGTLKVDKEALEKADIASIRGVFEGSNSVAGKLSAQSMYVESNAVNAINNMKSTSNMYGNGNNYGNSGFNSGYLGYNSGGSDLYSSYLNALSGNTYRA